MANEAAKQAVGRAAAQRVRNGMTVGLGTGSTAAFFVKALGERVRSEGLTVRGVPTSRAAEALAREAGIPLFPLTADTLPDMTIDGADQIDGGFHLIKGGGGALVQEKLVAVSSKEMIVVVDETKVVQTLGAFPLPVAVIPFGWETTQQRLRAAFPDVPAVLRRTPAGDPIITDDGLLLIDLHFGPTIADPESLQARLRAIVGIAEVGLFVGIASRVIIGKADGSIEERTAKGNP